MALIYQRDGMFSLFSMHYDSVYFKQDGGLTVATVQCKTVV